MSSDEDMKVRSIRMNDEMWELLGELADDVGVDRSKIVRQAITLTRVLFDDQMTLRMFLNEDILDMPISVLMRRVPEITEKLEIDVDEDVYNGENNSS